MILVRDDVTQKLGNALIALKLGRASKVDEFRKQQFDTAERNIELILSSVVSDGSVGDYAKPVPGAEA